MRTKTRRLGNSRGIQDPKPLPKRRRLKDGAEILVRRNTPAARRAKKAPRQGWAAASKEIAARSEDNLVWPEFANEADADWEW